ncbi:MAG TPA: hypothetical protein VM695_03850 [Phycisphaerae bacterium]|nr:hypothetical protein [Phycisphaerae bacterium]
MSFFSSRAAPAEAPAQVRVLGEATSTQGEIAVTGKSSTVVLQGLQGGPGRLTVELLLAAELPRGAQAAVVVAPNDANDLKQSALVRFGIQRGRGKDGPSVGLSPSSFDPSSRQWKKSAWTQAVNYKEDWNGRWLRLQVDFHKTAVSVWFEGLLLEEYARPESAAAVVAVQLCQGDRLRANVSPLEELYLPIDISATANERFAEPLGSSRIAVEGVPYHLAQDSRGCISLRKACWAAWKQDLPWSHESSAPSGLRDPNMPMLRVPLGDYCAAHVLAVADDGPGLTSSFTLRCGRFNRNGNSQNVQFDFRASAPRPSETGQVDPKSVVRTPGGPLFQVRVPMAHAFAQDLDKYIEIELTKEVRLARRSPDPCRFRYRPLGLPSGVRIAAITLERSAIQMKVGSAVAGHAFVEPQAPTFQVRLENITSGRQPYELSLSAVHLDGTRAEVKRRGVIEAGKQSELSVPLPVPKRGYYDLAVTLTDGKGRTLLCRQTSFALLPPDTRRHRDQSPFGTYDFGGAHYTCRDYDRIGPLYVKLGLRYGMFGAPPAVRGKYGLLKGNEPRADSFEKVLAKDPDTPPAALIFHETSISGRHITRVGDLFTDWPAYKLDEKEEQHLRKLWDGAVAAARAVRKKRPEVKLAFGNGPLPTKEEFYRRKFPAELFDSGGNESGSFGHPPESQPPDWLANNASLWMDRQLLDAYGYRDKPVTQCHEVCYPATTPGNLDPRTQAEYFVRHAIHSLAWGVPRFQPGLIMDVGGNYRWSHWGSAGFCRMYPEMNVKPAFVAFATMTWVLDGARFAGELPAGSPSVYAVRFQRPDGSLAVVLWTLRGRRPVTLRLDGDGAWKLIDGQANESAVDADGGRAEVTLTPSPVYLVGKGKVSSIEPDRPAYDDKPEGKAALLGRVASLDDWAVEKGRSPELEYYDFMTPRRKGDFAFEPVAEFQGKADVMRVTARPIDTGKDTMPMYAVLAHKKGIAIPGTPTEVGLHVNGNSGWGRIIFELQDSSGQRWISLGAQAKDDPASLLPKEVLDRFPSPGISDWNTDDAWALSRINFDGWRYVGVPLPGNYPGENYPWPANSQWRWDKDGVVHYPLTLRKLVVELPEKVLHLRTWAPPPRPEIYLGELFAGEGDTAKLKDSVAE